VSLSQSTFI